MSGELSGRQPQAIRAALDVLRTVVQAGPGITAKEISTALRLSPATTYRIINILVGEEYLVRLGDLSGFALGASYASLVMPGPPDQPVTTDEFDDTSQHIPATLSSPISARQLSTRGEL